MGQGLLLTDRTVTDGLVAEEDEYCADFRSGRYIVKRRSPVKILSSIFSVFSTGECMMSCVLNVLFFKYFGGSPSGGSFAECAMETPTAGAIFTWMRVSLAFDFVEFLRSLMRAPLVAAFPLGAAAA